MGEREERGHMPAFRVREASPSLDLSLGFGSKLISPGNLLLLAWLFLSRPWFFSVSCSLSFGSGLREREHRTLGVGREGMRRDGPASWVYFFRCDSVRDKQSCCPRALTATASYVQHDLFSSESSRPPSSRPPSSWCRRSSLSLSTPIWSFSSSAYLY